MNPLEKLLVILPHKLLANTDLTKKTTITVNDLLAYVRIVDLYSTSIISHMKITTCGHGNTLMVCIEHRWTIFYQEEKLRVQKEK